MEPEVETASVVADMAWLWDDPECIPVARRQLVHVRVERGEVPVDMPDGRRELGLRRSAVEDGDVVPILDQRAHDPGADEARAAEEQYVHRSSGRYSVSTWPATARYAPEPCKEGGSRWGTVRTSPSGS